MKKVYLSILFISFFCNSKAQQWEWAISADSVYGNQETKMVSQSGNVLYALIYQHGPSIINNTYLDSGTVIIKLNTNGNILWTKQYPGTIESLYAGKNGDVYFLGEFADSLDFLGTLLISHGGKDIFFGLLDANTGNKLWVTSAGSANDDWSIFYPDNFRHSIITDEHENLFIAADIHDDFHVGSQSLTGYSGLSTFLLRCDLNGNLLQAFSDTILNNTYYYNRGLELQKSAAGTPYLNAVYDSYNCPYYCTGNDILKIDPFNYTLSVAAHLTTSFEYLHSWTINHFDETIDANFNTGSHYLISYCVFHYSSPSLRTFRKGLGDGYDGLFTPFTQTGIGNEIIFGGDYDNDFTYYGNSIDTLWFDNLFLIPDSFPKIMIGGLNSANQFTWLLHSEDQGSSAMIDLASDQHGNIYCIGDYNEQAWLQDSIPNTITFGSTTLHAENLYTRFFLAAAGSVTTSISSEIADQNSSIQLFPNPSSGILNVECKMQNAELKIYNTFGQIIHQQIITSTHQQIDLSTHPKGVYIVKVENERRKIVLN